MSSETDRNTNQSSDTESSKTILSVERLKSLRKASNGDSRLFENVNLSMSRGESVVIAGPSGTGKTSLLWSLARLLPIESGEISLMGQPHHQISPTVWRSRVMLVMQKPVMSPGTVRDNLRLPTRLKVNSGKADMTGDGVLLEEMKTLGLEGIPLDRPASELSGGEAARVSFLRSVLANPDCLLLDEPAASLDEKTAGLLINRLRRYLDEGGCTLIVQHGKIELAEAKKLVLTNGCLEEQH